MGLFDSLKKILSPSRDDERTVLEKKLRAAPGDPQLRQKYAALLLRQGEVAGGIAELSRAADLYEKGGFASKAVAVLRQLLKHDPSDLDARRRLISLLAQEGLSGDAQHELERAAANQDLFASEDQRIEFLRGAAEALPGSPLPALLLSDSFRLQKKFFEAVTELEKAAPACAASAASLALFVERARAVTDLAEEDPERLEACGFLWLRAGQVEQALPLLEKVVAAAREGADPARLEDMEVVLEAIRGGSPAVVGASSFADALRRMAKPPEPAPAAGGAVGGTEGAPEEPADEDALMVRDAVSRLQRKVSEEIGESDHEARYNLGIAYKEMGLLDEAAEEFRISRADPALFVGATSLLADTLAQKGDFDGAVACLDEAIRRGNLGEAQARELRYQKGVVLAKAERAEEADAVFRAIFEETPDYRDVRERIGRLSH